MPAPKDPIKYKEYIDKISKSQKGRKQSQQQIDNRVNSRKRNGNYGHKHKGEKRPPFSQEWCNNISLGRKGSIPWNKGLKMGPLSEEHKKSISIANSKPKPPFTQEHKDNIKKARAFQIMKKRSQETIQKIKAKRALQILPMKDSKPERMMQIALALNGIKFEKHKMITNSMGFYHQVDLFVKPNICIEVDGDYIHGHPDKYQADDILKKGKKASEIWANDILINHKLNLLGYQVIRIWECDIKSDAQECLMNIVKLIKLNYSEVS